jgi:hypothetical protein
MEPVFLSIPGAYPHLSHGRCAEIVGVPDGVSEVFQAEQGESDAIFK